MALFSLALSFTSFRRTFVSRATCDADCDIADDATRLMAIAAAPGTAVLLIRLRFSTACSRPFMAIHPLSAATVNGRRYAPPKPEMTASAIIRRNPVYPEVFLTDGQHVAAPQLPHIISPDKQGRAGAFNAHALSGIADIFRVIKTPRITAPDCSPDVMVADVPMYPRIVSSAQAMAASNRLSKSATAPPVIAFWPGRALSFQLPHRQRHETPFPAAQMPQPHPAWREVHQYAASPVPQP